MRTPDVVGNTYCSQKLIREAKNQVVYLSVIYIFLGITTIVGNTLILIALHKNTSLHQPSKVLLRNLVASDLCIGFVQLLYGALGISILQGWWQICHHLFDVNNIAASISITVSLWTITAISVDRLLALLLKPRYRQVVTIRKVYAVAMASWVIGISNATLWCFSLLAWKILLGTKVAVCLITSAYCYIKTFLRLRHQHTQEKFQNRYGRLSRCLSHEIVFEISGALKERWRRDGDGSLHEESGKHLSKLKNK